MTEGTDRPAPVWEGSPATALAADWGLPEVHLYSSVGSTNDIAKSLAQDGSPAGTLVLAEEQTAGRGQAGRAWRSPSGAGIWMSMVLRPASIPAPGLLPLYVGLAAAKVVDSFAPPAPAQIKWPNDLQIDGRKLAGILCEASWISTGPAWVVVGIGMNVLQSIDQFPLELRETATSLTRELHHPVSRLDLAGRLARAIGQLTDFEPDDFVIRRINERDVLRGKRLQIIDSRTGEQQAMGVGAGIAADGALLLKQPSGEPHAIRSGSARPLDD